MAAHAPVLLPALALLLVIPGGGAQLAVPSCEHRPFGGDANIVSCGSALPGERRLLAKVVTWEDHHVYWALGVAQDGVVLEKRRCADDWSGWGWCRILHREPATHLGADRLAAYQFEVTELILEVPAGYDAVPYVVYRTGDYSLGGPLCPAVPPLLDHCYSTWT